VPAIYNEKIRNKNKRLNVSRKERKAGTKGAKRIEKMEINDYLLKCLWNCAKK